jgi:hypothetical protein
MWLILEIIHCLQLFKHSPLEAGFLSFIIEPGIETEYKIYFVTHDDGNKFIFWNIVFEKTHKDFTVLQ